MKINPSQNLFPEYKYSEQVLRAMLDLLSVFTDIDVIGMLQNTAWIFVAPLSVK